MDAPGVTAAADVPVAAGVPAVADVPGAEGAPGVACSPAPWSLGQILFFFLLKFFNVCYLFVDFFVYSEYNTTYTSGNCTAYTMKI